MSRILGPFCKRVLQSAASFHDIVTQQYLAQVLMKMLCEQTRELTHDFLDYV